MFYVYLLQSKKDNRYYIGHTNDIKQRLEEHNSGMVKSTRNRKPLEIIGYEEYKSRSEAMWRENEIKKSAFKRYQFIKNLCPVSSTGRAGSS